MKIPGIINDLSLQSCQYTLANKAVILQSPCLNCKKNTKQSNLLIQL